MEETVRGGERFSTRQRTLMWHALQRATWAVHQVGMWVCLTPGTTGLRDGRLQQLFRDLHAGTQHVVNGPMVIRNTGRELAGLAEGRRWVGLDLTDA